MTNYRNPGPTQRTNQRLHDKIRQAVQHGGSAQLAVATDVWVDDEAVDLSLRPARAAVADGCRLMHFSGLGDL